VIKVEMCGLNRDRTYSSRRPSAWFVGTLIRAAPKPDPEAAKPKDNGLAREANVPKVAWLNDAGDVVGEVMEYG